MANVIDVSKLTKSAKPATAAEWFRMNKAAEPEQGGGMDVAALAAAVQLIMSLLQQQKPEPRQQPEQEGDFAQRMGVNPADVGKLKTTKADAWGAIEKGAAEIQQQQPELSQAAAVTKYLETDEGTALYRLYKNIR